jgi:hypothetical protein
MSEKSEKWQSLQDKINTAIEEWRQEHPEAPEDFSIGGTA